MSVIEMAFHRFRKPNKSLKAVRVRSLDSFSRRMLRILRAALRCPLARRYVLSSQDHTIVDGFNTEI